MHRRSAGARADTPWCHWGRTALLAAAAALVVATHLRLALVSPLNFDEAYNLQIPLNLYLSGQYQSWYDTAQLFPPPITTGPSVLMPVALAFDVAGPDIHAARAVMTLFLLGFLWQVWVLTRRAAPGGGDWVCLASYALFLLVPLAPWVSSIVLGELPSAFFLLAGITCMARAIDRERSALAVAAGTLLGLAALAKLVAAICALPVLVAVACCGELHRRRWLALRFAVLGLLGLLLAIGAFEAYKVAVLGWDGYRDNFERFRTMMMLGGSGIDREGRLRAAPSVAQHVAVLGRELGLAATWVWTAVVIVGAATLLAVARRPRRFVVLAVAFASAAYWYWWLRHSMWTSLRHLHVGYLMLAVLLPCVAGVLAAWTARRLVRAALLAPLLAAALLAFPPWRTILPPDPGPALAAQYAAAEALQRVANNRPRAVFWSHGWYQAAEISFLAQRPFRDITRSAPDPTVPNVLVITSLRYAANYDHVAYAQRWCGFRIVQTPEALACLLRGEAPRGVDRGNHP